MDEGLDVAIRIGELPDSSQMARRVGSLRHCIFAAPAYIEDHGAPSHPKELADHRLIQPLTMGGTTEWRFRENGKHISVSVESRLSMNTNDGIIEAVLQGWGVSRLLSYQLAPYVAEGSLHTLLDKFEMPPIPIHILHQEGKLVSAKVRAFVDYMVDRLSGDAGLF